jgi:hypothetical protein
MKAEEVRDARQRYAGRSIPELIELLAEDDLQTRFLAEMALGRCDQHLIEFPACGPPGQMQEERSRAIAEWREWRRTNQQTFKKRWQAKKTNHLSAAPFPDARKTSPHSANASLNSSCEYRPGE